MTEMTERLNLRRPAEGWITLVIMIGLAFVLGWSIDDPAWVNGHGEWTDFLATCGIAGVLIGFAGPKLGWGRWTTHLIGATFAALVIPILAGQARYPDMSIGEAFHAVAYGSVEAYLDLAWRGLQLTSQDIHYSLVLGIIVWGTMQFASYAVFGHRRPLAAVVVIGLVLVVNMSLTNRDREQLSYMVAFTGLALFLLIQMHAFDERATWIRRRIGDPSTISALYLRGGTVFIVGAMALSMVLTVRASSSPLQGAWSGVGSRLVSMGQEISRLLPIGGAVRPIGPLSFGSVARISSKWFIDDRIAFTAAVPATFDERWRAAVYDSWEGDGWIQTTDDITAYPVEAGQPLLDGTAEQVKTDLTIPIQVTVDPVDYAEGLLLAPGAPLTTTQDTNVELFGTNDAYFADVRLRDGSGGPYQVNAAAWKILSSDNKQTDVGLTQNKLRADTTVYPPDVARYTVVPDGVMGPYARDLLKTVKALATGNDPYDLAVAMETYLASDKNFNYETDLSGVDCGSDSWVECFARVKKGFCMQYASTMAILMRAAYPDHPIPTRFVQGFLPGDVKNGTTTVRARDAHAWVEVYFPSYGWIPFDPTGKVGLRASLPVGAQHAQATPRPAPSFNPSDRDQEGPSGRPKGVGADLTPTNSGGGPSDRALLILFAVVVAAGVLGLAFIAWLRGPRGELSPDAAWKNLSRTASRFGFAPRPTQTVYEYAGTLGELVPVAERDIQTVATAKVETAYAGVRVAGARMDAVRDATRRLRISLLRLAFRRPKRRKR